MAQTGNTYTVPLKMPHIAWGEYRNPTNRDVISGEAYIPIPRNYAKAFDIFNSNHTSEGLGFNLFHVTTHDGFLDGEILLAQGSSSAGDIYAKQFSVHKNLKLLGEWFQNNNVTTNNSIRVTWTNPTTIHLEII